MILFEIFKSENNPVYQALEVSNGLRQYDFLKSIVDTAAAIQRPYLSQHLIKALNFQAIVCLHTNAGEYRPCPVQVGNHIPPEHYRVDALMEDFVNIVNRFWSESDPVFLAAYVLWQLNYIHPFINGNGRTARAACYFVLCMHLGKWLPGQTILPELIRKYHPEYVIALRAADAAYATGKIDLTELHALLVRLLEEQIHGVAPGAVAPAPAPAPALPPPNVEPP